MRIIDKILQRAHEERTRGEDPTYVVLSREQLAQLHQESGPVNHVHGLKVIPEGAAIVLFHNQK